MPSLQKEYRVYGYDRALKNVTCDWIEAPNDEEAIAQAERLRFTRFELWLGDRLVTALGEERRTA